MPALRRLIPAATAALSTALLAGLLVIGLTPGADTVLWAPGADNGLQVADLPIVLVGLVGVVACGSAARLRSDRRRLAAAVAAIVLTFLMLTLIKGDGPDSGTTLLALAPGLGVNVGDVPVLVVWLTGVLACAVLLPERDPAGPRARS